MGGPRRTNCKDCNIILTTENAILRGGSFRERCRNCRNKYQNEWQNNRYNTDEEHRQKNLQGQWERHIKRTYGITEEQYKEMYTAQGGVCAICKFPCASGDRLSVDHCHRTNAVRGLLCKSCNIAIAAVNESEELIYSMLDYLRQYNDTATVQLRPSLKPEVEN